MSEPAGHAVRAVDRVPRLAIAARIFTRIPPGAATAIMCVLTVVAALGHGASGP